MQISYDEMAKRLFDALSRVTTGGAKYTCVGHIAHRLGLDFQKIETHLKVLGIRISGEPSSQLNEQEAISVISRIFWIHPEVTESELSKATIYLRKWRGSSEDLQSADAPRVVFEFPTQWLDREYRNTTRKAVLKDMLLWAVRGNLIRPLAEISDALLLRRIIPVKLAPRGKMLALEAAGRKVVGWLAGLNEAGIQVKIFTKSEIEGEFNVLPFNLLRPDTEYTKVAPETGEWQYGVIAEWRKSFPNGLIEELSHGRAAESSLSGECASDTTPEVPSDLEEEPEGEETLWERWVEGRLDSRSEWEE